VAVGGHDGRESVARCGHGERESREVVCLVDVGRCRSLSGNTKGLDASRTVRKVGRGLRLRGDAASDALLVGVIVLYLHVQIAGTVIAFC